MQEVRSADDHLDDPLAGLDDTTREYIKNVLNPFLLKFTEPLLRKRPEDPMDFAIAWLRERSGLPATNDFTMSPLHVDDYTELNAYFYEDVLGDVATECRFLKPDDPVPVALDFLEQRKEGDEEKHGSRLVGKAWWGGWDTREDWGWQGGMRSHESLVPFVSM